MKKFTGFLLITVLLAACVKKEEYDFSNFSSAGWEPQLAIPLVKSTMEVKDILGFTDSSVVTSDGSGLVTLVYNSEVQEFVAGDLVDLADFSNSVTAGVANGTAVVDVPFDIPGEQEFTRIILEKGNLNIDLNTSSSGTATVKLLSITDAQGSPLEMTGPLGSVINFDLANATVEPNANNDISIEIEFKSVSSPGSMNLGFAMTGMDYKTLFGDFKDKLIRLPQDSLKIHLFKNIASDGNIHLEDPKIIIDFENSLGVPLGLLLDSVDGYNPVTKHLFEVIKSGIGSFTVGAPTTQNVGTTVNTQIILDRNNTNVANVFQPTPTFLVHSIGVNANPDGGTSENFVEKGAKCRMEMRIELPLVGRVEKFQILDTVPISLDSDIDILQQATIKTYLENGFPIDATVRAVILDENYAPLTLSNGDEVSLINSVQIAASAVLDSDGKVTESGILSTVHELDEEKTQLLTKAKYVLVTASLTTTNNGQTTVKIFDDYKISLKLGVKLKGDPGII